MRIINIIIIFLVFVNIVNSQKVKYLPAKFYPPTAYTDKQKWEDQMFSVEKTKVKESLKQPKHWRIIGDRDTKTYTSPDFNSEIKDELKFKETAYVIDEKKEWIHIAKSVDSRLRPYDKELKGEIKDFGWVRKDKVLLWPQSLVNENNNIHLKGFILNKAVAINEIIKKKNRKIVSIYKSPETSETIRNLELYDFFFIYKIEGTRYLLGRNYDLKNSVEDDLMGWIDKYQLTKWNTRVALEPNFEKEAFEERKANKNLRVVGFETIEEVDQFAKTGKIIKKPLWDNDPVKIAPSLLAKSNPRRHKGAVIRFPVLERNQNFFTSGAINKLPTYSKDKNFKNKEGEIDEISYALMNEIVLNCEKKKNNINIFFLIEGTPENNGIQSIISSVVDEIKTNINYDVNFMFGAGIYRDIEQKNINKDFELFECNKNIDLFNEFLKGIAFEEYGETDDWTDLNYGLYNSLVKGGFSKEETNILFIIGNNVDFKFDPARRYAAKANDEKYIISYKKLANKLAQYEMNTFFVQPILNRNNISSYEFVSKYRALLLRTANNHYTNYKKVLPLLEGKINPPTIPEPDSISQKHLTLENGIGISEIIYPGKYNNKLDGEEISQFFIENINKVIEKVNNLHETFSKVIYDGEGIDIDENSGYWGADILNVIAKELEKYENEESVKKDLVLITQEKLKLYHKIFLPRKILGARYDPFSFVVFMPESELRVYAFQLKKLKNSMTESMDEIRESLYDTFEEMMVRLAGEKIDNEGIEKSSIDQLRALMNGIEDEGYYIGDKLNFDLGDIKNPKIMSDERIYDLGDRIQEKYQIINGILNQGNKYEFSYTVNGNTYYWIDANYLF